MKHRAAKHEAEPSRRVCNKHSVPPFTSAQHSRHIDRKLFKMREMRGAGQVQVRYVPTNDNTSDIFTKILARQLFEKHRRTVLNLAGAK